jgi:SH3-like domain-containing protein
MAIRWQIGGIIRLVAIGLYAAWLSAPAAALDFMTVNAPAVLFDAPSAKASPLFVIYAGTPVEQVVNLEGWVKVRDSQGHIAWIEKKFLGGKRQAMVRADRAQIRAAADDNAALVFEAERDVVLDLLETLPTGWAKVKHRDGQSGFIKAAQVWGL